MHLYNPITTFTVLALSACDVPPEPSQAQFEEIESCSGIELVRLKLDRSKGAPQEQATSFTSTQQLCVEVVSGDGTKKSAPSSAEVMLGDLGRVVGPNAFDNTSWVRSFSIQASEGGTREITARLSSGPGSHLEVAVYDEGFDLGAVPPGATSEPIYPEESGRLDLPNSTVRWLAGTTTEPTLIWCSESLDGPEIILDCGPAMAFSSPIFVDLAVSEDMILQTLESPNEAPTVVWDGEPRPTITNVTTRTAHAAITHFCQGTVNLYPYITEEVNGEVFNWSDMHQAQYPYQKLDSLMVIPGTVNEKAYDQYILPKVPGTALEIKLTTLEGDADVFTHYLEDPSRTHYQKRSIVGGELLDSVWVPVNKADDYFVAVQGYWDGVGTSEYLLSVQQENRLAGVGPATWTVVLDAGHKTSGNDEPTEKDETNAKKEREFNERLVNATMGALGEVDMSGAWVNVVTYDGVILPWAATELNESIDQLREWENFAMMGGAGFRGLLIRKWVKANDLDPKHTVALQIHNDNKSFAFDPLGSQASSLGDGSAAQEQLYCALEKAMNGTVLQPWQDQLLASAPNQAFVRGATGYTSCEKENTIRLEAACDLAYIKNRETAYGPALVAASLLEVAHYSSDHDLLYVENSDFLESSPMFETEDEFIDRTGQALAVAIRDFVLLLSTPK